MAAALEAIGAVCILKGSGRIQVLGAMLLALGCVTHEVSLFVAGIFCATALVFDFVGKRRAIALWVIFTVALFATESVVYQSLLGDPFARLKAIIGTTVSGRAGVDPDGLLSNFAFFSWPIQNLAFSKQFGFSLGATFVAGSLGWTRLDKSQRVLLLSTFLIWFWLGYGSQVPWAYRPLYRQFHYYGFLTLGVAALLPTCLAAVCSGRVARTLVGAALIVHIGSLAAGVAGELRLTSREIRRPMLGRIRMRSF